MEAFQYVQVDFLQGEGEAPPVVDTFVMEADTLRSEEETAVASFHSRAEQLMPPGHTVRRLLYKDDEGDWCTLNGDTLRDALSFLIPRDGIGHIQFRVVAEGAPPAPEQELAIAGEEAWEKAEPEVAVIEALPPSLPSAWVLSCPELAAGAGVAWEDCPARGDATAEFADILVEFGVRQAARLGRVVISAEENTPEVPVLAKCVVKNDGEVPWPDTVAVTPVFGEDLALRHTPLGTLGPGEVAEVVLDLRLPARSTPCSSSASWVFVDAATGVPLGPILLFEALWVA